MSTEDVAMRLVELCKGSEWKKAVDDLYAKDIVSVEPRQMESMPAEMRGIDQVRGKNDWWEKNMEVHDSKVSGPFIAGDTFVVRFDIDATDSRAGAEGRAGRWRRPYEPHRRQRSRSFRCAGILRFSESICDSDLSGADQQVMGNRGSRS